MQTVQARKWIVLPGMLPLTLKRNPVYWQTAGVGSSPAYQKLYPRRPGVTGAGAHISLAVVRKGVDYTPQKAEHEKEVHHRATHRRSRQEHIDHWQHTASL